MTVLVGTLAGVVGLLLSYRLYAVPSTIPEELAVRFLPLYRASHEKFWVDEIYMWTGHSPAPRAGPDQ